MTHGAPDWERTAVGPGGEPLGGLTPIGNATCPDTLFVPGGSVTLANFNCTNTAIGLALLSFAVPCLYTVGGLGTTAFGVVAGGNFTPYSGGPFPVFGVVPGVAVTDAVIYAHWCGLVTLTAVDALIVLDLVCQVGTTGEAVCSNNNIIGLAM